MSRSGNIKSRLGTENETVIEKMVKILMKDGKKQTAMKIMHSVLDLVQKKSNEDPLVVFDAALSNVRPIIESRACRVSGVTYNIPCEVSYKRSVSLGLKLLCEVAAAKKGVDMIEGLSSEIMEAYNSSGAAFRKKEQNAKMAEANRAFAHLRWFKNKKRVNN